MGSGKHGIPAREAALRTWCAQRGASIEHRLLLRAVMGGARGPGLAEELGLSLDDVADHEDEFITVMRISVYEAAIDVLSTVRRRRKSLFGLDAGTND